MIRNYQQWSLRPMISSFKRGAAFPALMLVGLLAAAGFVATRSTAEEARPAPLPAVDEQVGAKTSEVAVIAGGCFWGVQGVFQHVAGVTNAVSGYAGGEKATAHYEMTSNGDTGHAESVQITYDPRKITYGRILQVYFSVAHDPTELNRQGPDEGTQYRSTIFPLSDEQARVAKAYIAQLGSAHVFEAPIVTTVEPGKTFYRAEDYHQDFLAKNPSYPYIVYNDLPKISNLKRLFPALYRPDPVLVSAARS
jgi:peptide-methionine (S)-S-oxide reductase